MDADLKRLPLVLQENTALRVGVDSLQASNGHLRRSILARDTALAATERRVYFTGLLRDDAQAQSNAWKLKAKRRWWVNLGLATLTVGITSLAITR